MEASAISEVPYRIMFGYFSNGVLTVLEVSLDEGEALKVRSWNIFPLDALREHLCAPQYIPGIDFGPGTVETALSSDL